MSYSFLNQQDKLSHLLGDNDTSSESMFPLAIRKKELNRGEMQFAVLSKCIKEYATATVSDKKIAVPSDWIATAYLIVGGVVITNDREISLSQWERYKDWSGDRPFYYFWEFSGIREIRFLGSTNINSQTYELYYFKKPTTELDADGDTSLAPEEYREAPAYYAAGELLLTMGKTNLASVFKNEFATRTLIAKSEHSDKFIDQELPRPDFGPGTDIAQNDIQGQGILR